MNAADLRRIINAIPTLVRVGWADIVAYRAEMVIWILTSSLPLVMLALWNAAAADGPIGRFGQTEFARYFTITLVVRQLCGAWIMWDLNYQIRTGGLSPWLLRPVPMPLWNLAETVVALPFRLVVMAPMLGALIAWRPDLLFSPALSTVLLSALSCAMAFGVTWLIQCMFGLLAFWVDQTTGLYAAYFAVWSLLSGYFVPLELLPARVAAIADWLPFRASLGAPVDLLMGADPGTILAAQAGWLAVAAVATVMLWQRGVKRYGAYGA